MVVSREAKKKQDARMSSALCDHYNELLLLLIDEHYNYKKMINRGHWPSFDCVHILICLFQYLSNLNLNVMLV